MEEGHTGGAAQEAFLQNFAGFGRGAVEGAAVDVHFANQAVALVEEQGAEDFLVASLVMQGQIPGQLRRAAARALYCDMDIAPCREVDIPSLLFLGLALSSERDS
jgi:hypothetical protein